MDWPRSQTKGLSMGNSVTRNIQRNESHRRKDNKSETIRASPTISVPSKENMSSRTNGTTTRAAERKVLGKVELEEDDGLYW